MDLTYDELRRIYRLEKATSKLVEVEEGFYSDLSSFISREKKDYLASLKNFSSSKARNFTNIKKMVEEIFSMREKKLLNKALVTSRTGEETEEKLASEEKKTYKELLAVLNKHRQFLLQSFEAESSETPQKQLVSLKILKEVPAFVGPDMKEYGPFSEGAVVSLPSKVSKLLLARKLGENQS